MSLAPGTRFGSYEILSPLGAGGMGEVYLAKDPKLKREVAIKILPDAFALDEARRKRFEREAQVLASLNHPNIAAIYGLEEHSGVSALVLELVEGPTLAERIEAGPIPLEEAIAIAKQIAYGLEAAHDKGVIHRDLKPANVKLTKDGDVKILDFGLAKLAEAEPEAVGEDSSHSPTLTRAATQAGVLLGTAAYMSPEQAKGKAVDRRADVWAFGAVLYEMLTGTRAFAGEDVSETLAFVLTKEPDWDAIPADTPEALQRVLRLCLSKDRKRRLRDVGDALLVMEGAFETSSANAPEAARRAFPPWMGALALLVVSLLAGAIGFGLRPEAARPLARFVVARASDSILARTTSDVAITPDGTRIVYQDGNELVVRALDRLEAAPLALGEDPRNPFLSPDGNWVGYFDRGRLRKVSIHGGPPLTLCALPGPPRGASWGDDGAIVIAGGQSGLWRVDAAGGEPEKLTQPDGTMLHYWPETLPGGEAVLFTAFAGSVESAQIAVLSLATRETRGLVPGGSHPRYAPTGHIVYGVAGTLRAVGFDLERLEVTTEPIPVLEGVVTKSSGAADFALARDGSLVYVEGAPVVSELERRLLWVDREGREEVLKAPPRAYFYPRLSPDGSRLALDVRDQESDIWIWDLSRETLTRLTFGPAGDVYPVWTPDGGRVAFGSGGNLFWKAADGTGGVEHLAESANSQAPYTFSPDGKRLVFREVQSDNRSDVFVLSLEERETALLLAGPSDERNAEISPDGRFLAYESDESGRSEIYVRPFPNVHDGRWQVSRNGGSEPLWARSGRELFYRAPGGEVLSVPVQTEPGFTLGNPELVVESGYFAGPPPGRTYDVSLDGQRFLMIKEGSAHDEGAEAQIILVQNWAEELKRLVPARK